MQEDSVEFPVNILNGPGMNNLTGLFFKYNKHQGLDVQTDSIILVYYI